MLVLEKNFVIKINILTNAWRIAKFLLTSHISRVDATSHISQIFSEARKHEIVGSIVGNNGTPKLPFPTSSSLCAELAVSHSSAP